MQTDQMGLGDKLFHGMVWSAMERISIQAVQFVIGIILARILTPTEYGMIGILVVFMAISEVFIESGFTKALIQKQDRTEDDVSTVFLFNIAISIVCYVILWFIAPLVADFYEMDILSALLRVLALSLLINALFAVPATIFTIDLDFKSLAKINFVASIVSGGIAIYMAYNGYGVWALVFQTLLRSLVMAILMWTLLKWQPNWAFSKSSLKQLFKYGSNLLAASLLQTTVNNFYALFIAKFTSTRDLGYYTRGTQFTSFFLNIMKSMLGRVLLPGLATVQDQRKVLVNYTRKIIKATAILVIPVFLFLAIIAEPLIRFLLTEKWLPAVPIMQIFCLARMITLISSINVNLLYVIGRTDLSLRQQFVKLAVRVVLLVVALKFGIIYIALAELTSIIIHFFINTYYPGKIMSYGAFSQLKDIATIFISGLIMIALVYGVINFIETDILKLLVAPVIAIPVYVAFMYLFKVKEFFVLISKTKSFFKK
ncbi:MAG: lipopolysaccharide biosynthesis protein [Saonia sp.]